MLKLRLPKLVALGTFALGLFSTAYAEIAPLRVGPVSQYGQLQAGTNNAGEGRIYGSCEHFRSSGNEVQVKGMSLFWSCAANQQRYWKKDIITGLVERQNIQLIRAAMAVDDMGEWADGHYFTKPVFYQAMLDEAVEAAIENDIYVIIDFHSHVAADSVENAKSFFRIQAEKWGKYDNVIFEVFNEPICASGSVGDNSDCSEYGGFISMDDIKTYADQVISVIREYSDNLIIVGTPMWDQYPNQAIYNHVEDPLERDNIAYASFRFH
jgi:aryl-phospho-beta-D-glucosidase BglC (GH1 family)